MKIRNKYLKNLYREAEKVRKYNYDLFNGIHGDDPRIDNVMSRITIAQSLIEDIGWCDNHISSATMLEEPRQTAFFLKIIWLDDPKTLFSQWSVIDTDNINLVEYSKLAYKKIKDNTIDESFMKEFKFVVKLLS